MTSPTVLRTPHPENQKGTSPRVMLQSRAMLPAALLQNSTAGAGHALEVSEEVLKKQNVFLRTRKTDAQSRMSGMPSLAVSVFGGKRINLQARMAVRQRIDPSRPLDIWTDPRVLGKGSEGCVVEVTMVTRGPRGEEVEKNAAGKFGKRAQTEARILQRLWEVCGPSLPKGRIPAFLGAIKPKDLHAAGGLPDTVLPFLWRKKETAWGALMEFAEWRNLEEVILSNDPLYSLHALDRSLAPSGNSPEGHGLAEAYSCPAARKRVEENIERVSRLVADSLSTLSILAAKGMWHMDVKPGNLVRGEEGGTPVMKFLDFRLSILLHDGLGGTNI